MTALPTPAIELRALDKRYGDRLAVAGVNLQVAPG
jgi:ABC-type multidrug transport system ATPase subunit